MAEALSKRVIEEIRTRCDIADVIGSYFHLQRAGSAFRALCPFHKEKTPSFHVNPQRQIFHCFGCGAGGDVFRFIMQKESVDFMGAVKMLAQRAGVRLEWEDATPGEKTAKDVLYRLHAEVADVYHRGLLKSPAAAAARAYLQQRKLPDDVVEAFQIGYAPDAWDVILNWALKKKYTLDQIHSAGLIIPSEREGAPKRHYDRFRNRLMFPIRDEQGRVIAFSGRAIEKDAGGAKYVNSPETPLFRKGHVLYALDKARHAIVEKRQALLCEGQIDVIRCHSAGFTHAVASQGTAFTEDHARTLKRYADEIILVFDSDQAGQDATVKAARIFLQADLSVRVSSLPPGEDPDSLILKDGAGAFAAVTGTAKSIVDFQVDLLSARYDVATEAGALQATRAVLETIAYAPSEIHRNHLLSQCATRMQTYGSNPAALRAELSHLMRRMRTRAPDAPDTPTSAVQPGEEVALVEHVVADPELGALVTQYLPLDMVTDPLCRSVIAAAVRAAQDGTPLVDVIAQMDDANGELSRFAARVQMAPHKTAGTEYSRGDAVKDLILNLWRRRFKRRINEIDRLRTSGAGDDPTGLRAEGIQLRGDIKLLNRWDTGGAIISIHV